MDSKFGGRVLDTDSLVTRKTVCSTQETVHHAAFCTAGQHHADLEQVLSTIAVYLPLEDHV